jgi:hemolysin activation/secretion protein
MKKSYSRLAVSALGYACIQAFCSPAEAQTPPGIGNVLKEAETTRPQALPNRDAPRIEQREEAPLSLPVGKTLEVKAFRIEGAPASAPEAEIKQVLTPFKDRSLDMAQINQAAAKVTELLRARGFIVARTYVPKQDASQGTLTLQIIAGRVEKLTVKNQSLVNDITLAGFFAPVSAEPELTRQSLERAMLLIDDLPGAPLPRLTIAPGEAPGSSDLTLEAGPDRRVNGYVLGDNMGSRYTGKYRISAGLDVNAPTGIGDRFSVTATDSEGGRLDNARVAYSAPIGESGLRAELAASNTTYTLGGDYLDLEATGNARTVEGTLSYPLKRSRDDTWLASLNLASKNLKDEIKAADTSTPKTAHVATFQVSREHWSSALGKPLHSNLSVGLSYGELRIDDAIEATLNQAGANTVGHYGKFNAALASTLELTQKWNLSLNASAQKALMGNNLDSSEQMNIAGPGAVKAYREVVSGDNGYLLNTELRHALPGEKFHHSVAGFADLGRVYLEDGAYTTGNGTRLSDIGMDYQIGYRAWMTRAMVARTVGPRLEDSANRAKTRVLLQMGMIF